MLIKRYHVQQESEAKARIEEELGPDAITLTCTPSLQGKFIVTAGIDAEDFARFRGQDAVFPVDEEEKILPTQHQRLSTVSKALENLLEKSIEMKREEKKASSKNLSAFLVTKGLDQILADKIDAAMWEKFPGSEITTEGPQRESFLNALKHLLIPYFPSGGNIPTGNKTPQVVAFIGPSAAGRTTALAKVALKTVQEGKGAVAFIAFTSSHPLHTLKEKGVNVYLVNDRNQLLEALKCCHRHQAIFIDAPSTTNLGALFAGIPHLEVHLVLSATMKSEDQLDAVRSYQLLNPVTLVLTMMDRTKTPASIANVLAHYPLPLSIFTSDAKIIDNIIVADPIHLVYHILFGTAPKMELTYPHAYKN